MSMLMSMPINPWNYPPQRVSIKYSTRMLCAIVFYVRLSVCPSVYRSFFTITQEWVDIEWWNFAHVHLRSIVISSSKMGHAFDLWPGTRSNWSLHNAHAQSADKTASCTCTSYPIPVEYLYIHMCYSSLLLSYFVFI